MTVYSEKATVVRLGDFNYGSNEDDTQPINIRIAEVIAHPNYTENIAYNNIALLRLNQTVEFNEFIKPACLSQPQKAQITQGVVAGWLFKLYHVPSTAQRRQDRKIRKYDVNLVPFAECEEKFKSHQIEVIPNGITDTFCCASIINDSNQSDAEEFHMLKPLEVGKTND